MWEFDTGKCKYVLKGHTEYVHSVSVTSDGKRAVSESGDRTFRVWKLDTGRCLRVLKGPTDLMPGVRVTPDGLRAVSTSNDKTLRVWELETGKCLALAWLSAGGTAELAFSSKISLLIIASFTGQVLEFDLHGRSLNATSHAS